MHDQHYKGFVALEIALYVALNPGAELLRAKDLCKLLSFSERYLETVLQRLVAGGILKSIRGPHGGYKLAKEKRKILIADIFRAEAHNVPKGELRQDSNRLHKEMIFPIWKRTEDAFEEELSTMTLQDLYDEAKEAGFAEEDSDTFHYTI